VAKALIPADDILRRALELLDQQGSSALNIRRLSADLGISPRTLYKQVGNQEDLTRALVNRHFMELELTFTECPRWADTARNWCIELYSALTAHPHLTDLMTIDDRAVVTQYVMALLTSATKAGIPEPLAIRCCRGLTNITVNQAIVQVRSLADSRLSAEAIHQAAKLESSFFDVVDWVISSVERETALT